MKFINSNQTIFEEIKNAKSAHDAQKLTIQYKNEINKDWNNIKTDIMKDILKHKVEQHPYVLKKLLESGNREIIEDSWRDAEWGWGENKNGKNLLGKVWMELREEYLKKDPNQQQN